MNKFADVRALPQLWFPGESDLNQASDHDDVQLPVAVRLKHCGDREESA